MNDFDKIALSELLRQALEKLEEGDYNLDEQREALRDFAEVAPGSELDHFTYGFLLGCEFATDRLSEIYGFDLNKV